MATVLVTGASGFVAGHLIAELLAHGHRVRGSVRRPHPELERFDIELVEADLSDPTPWPEAARGCEYVLHTASPLPLGEVDEAQLIATAVEGTRNVLRGCAEAKVQRVVLTSSSASIVNADRPAGHTFTGADWSDPALCSAYPKSKTLAERAAWELAKEHELPLVTVNPVLVIGPVQIPRVNTSLEPIRRLLARALPAVPKLGFSLVDVRDVARAHRLAMEQPEAVGNRYLLTGGFMWMRDIARFLDDRFPQRRVPTLPLPYPLLWLASRFDPGLRQVLSEVGVRRTLSSARAQAELGWQPRELRESLLDTAQALIEHDLV